MLQERVSDLYSLVMEINKQIETISTNFNKGPERISHPPKIRFVSLAKTFFITEKSETHSTYEDKGKYFLLFLQVNDFFLLKVCYYDKVSNIFKRKGYFGKEIPKRRIPFLVTCIIRFENIFPAGVR